MIIRRIAFVLILSAIGLPVHALDRGSTLVHLPCRNDKLIRLIESYTSRTVTSQLHTEARTHLSRIGQARIDEMTCVARVDIDYKGGGDVVWVKYFLSQAKSHAVFVSFKSARPLVGYTLPQDTNPKRLEASWSTAKKITRPNRTVTVKANSPEVPIAKSEILGEARRRLLAAGWRPRITLKRKGVVGPAVTFIAAGYPEIASCAADWGYCNLNYVDTNGTCLTVTSEGEEPKSAVVSSWRFGCPIKTTR